MIRQRIPQHASFMFYNATARSFAFEASVRYRLKKSPTISRHANPPNLSKLILKLISLFKRTSTTSPLQELCVPADSVQARPRLRSASTGCIQLHQSVSRACGAKILRKSSTVSVECTNVTDDRHNCDDNSRT